MFIFFVLPYVNSLQDPYVNSLQDPYVNSLQLLTIYIMVGGALRAIYFSFNFSLLVTSS
jgi:hypothetical protein